MKRIATLVALFPMAFVLAAPTPPPPSSSSGGSVLPLIPIACSIAMPWLSSARLKRELTGEEISATTLMCFTGPLGYYIATEKGWIGPDFFKRQPEN